MSIAARYWTYTELLAKVEQDLDLEGELFVQPTEMLGYANEAVDDAERIVKGAYSDYFLDKDTITLVSGTSEYSLPSRIYAHKLRRVIYRNGTRIYTIDRLRDWHKFEEYETNTVVGAGTWLYRYMIFNTTAGAPKILFTPSVGESGEYIHVWFIRQANRFVSGSDVLDIPEAANYVMQYMKTRCYEKEGHPMYGAAVAALAQAREDLEGDLAEMVPDADDSVEMDVSFYEDMA